MLKSEILKTDKDSDVQSDVIHRCYRTTKERNFFCQEPRRFQVWRHSSCLIAINVFSFPLLKCVFFLNYRWELGCDEALTTPNINSVDSSESNRPVRIGPELIVALQFCETLRRFVILADKTVTVDLVNANFNFKSLILACIISPNISWNASECPITSSHPAFQCYLGSSVTEAGSQLPAVHFNEMVLFESHILKLPVKHSF